MAEGDVELLISFVRDLRGLLAEVVDDPRNLIHKPRRQDLEAAWEEIERREAFNHLTQALAAADIEDALADRGLTDAQLRLKLGGFYYWLAYRTRTGPTKRAPRRWFRRALKWADIVLDSLGSVAALGIRVDPIREIKDSFLQAAEDRERG
jgi:hypothetical protein